MKKITKAVITILVIFIAFLIAQWSFLASAIYTLIALAIYGSALKWQKILHEENDSRKNH